MEANRKVKELVKTLESIIHGDGKQMGLFDCYDTYYNGCWDKKLAKVQELKKELNINP